MGAFGKADYETGAQLMTRSANTEGVLGRIRSMMASKRRKSIYQEVEEECDEIREVFAGLHRTLRNIHRNGITGPETGPTTMNKQVTMTMYAHKASEWTDHEYNLFHCDMSEHGYISLGPVEVTFTAPGRDPLAADLESIDKAITAVRAELQDKLNALQERRDSLLAITNNKESDDD